MPLILGANSLAGGYQIKNSARFNSGSSDYLNRTFTTPTNRKIFTFSTWLKKTKNGDYFNLFSANHSTTNAQNWLGFSTASYDDLYFNEFDGSSYNFRITTTQLFRDVSAFYHLVVAVDTTQATASNRIKIYVNGTQVTSFVHETYPSQNYEMKMNSAVNHAIGTGLYNGSQSYFLNAYVTETYFIDGQSLTPSSFGETDTDTGIWKPKAYTGSFGTNGFYLDFEDSANLGNDMSGNNNDFTVNNLTSIDQTTDTPTNNFCTLNPLDNGNSNILTSNGNNSVSSSTTWDRGIKATFGISSGKWYWEYKHGTVNSGTNPAGDLGITKYSSLINSASNGGATNSESYFIGGQDGSKYNGSYTPTSYGSSFTTGDIAMLALDMDNGKFYMGKNGTWFNSGNPATSTNPAFTSLSGTFFPVWYWGISAGTSGVLISDFNFGNAPFTIASGNADANGYGNFEYAVPSGYYSLCTKNLADFG